MRYVCQPKPACASALSHHNTSASTIVAQNTIYYNCHPHLLQCSPTNNAPIQGRSSNRQIPPSPPVRQNIRTRPSHEYSTRKQGLKKSTIVERKKTPPFTPKSQYKIYPLPPIFMYSSTVRYLLAFENNYPNRSLNPLPYPAISNIAASTRRRRRRQLQPPNNVEMTSHLLAATLRLSLVQYVQ